MEAVTGKHSIDSLQKTAILGTSHIIRKVLQCEARSVSGGDQLLVQEKYREEMPVTETSISYINNNNNGDHGNTVVKVL